ncbi:hypothetical protein [Ferrimonas gelatinilytica]|uniref:Uncharacterized protein n=1 Tax=Ferrimonas gelatinilytica TaxID=1255257 RepID=A0ABP9SGE5_9GAMM
MAQIQIGIDSELLAQLLKGRDLCVARLVPLNPGSKQWLWHFCLEHCQEEIVLSGSPDTSEPRRGAARIPVLAVGDDGLTCTDHR